MAVDGNNSRGRGKKRWIFRLALVAALLVGLHLLAGRAGWHIEMELQPMHERMGFSLLIIAVGAYILFMMLPFVPGMEIGLGIIMIFGNQGVIVVYFATVAALVLSFLVGRLIPFEVISRILGWLHLERAQRLLGQIDPADPLEGLNQIVQKAPARVLPFLLRHRYLAVAIALNLPGNSFIGGGGGIGMVAGMSRMFRFDAYLLMIGIAVSPVPIILLTTSTVPLLFS